MDPNHRPVGVKKEAECPSEGAAHPGFETFRHDAFSPAPTHQYSPTEVWPADGDGDEPGDDGYGGDGNDGNDDEPPNPPNPNGEGDKDKGRKNPKKNVPKGGSGPPDGGDDDDGAGGNDDDDDEKFRRRMIKFLGGFVEQKGDDKPKVGS